MKTVVVLAVLWTVLFGYPRGAEGGEPLARHVVIIGLDGARPDAIQQAAGPALRGLIERGSVCWRASAARPTVTQVNWATILTGCSPQKHGIDMNPVTEAQLAPLRVRVPTVMDVVAKHGGTAAAFLGHWKLYPVETGTPGVHVEHSPYPAREAAAVAARYIEQNKPQFTFVYMGDLDGLGHRFGWMSKEYLAGMAEVDAAVQAVLDAVGRAGILDQTLIVVASDHGGHGKAHSAGTAEDAKVPVILAGPGVRMGGTIEDSVSNSDIAPTVLFALRIERPVEWDGMVITSALVESAAGKPRAAEGVKEEKVEDVRPRDR
jgi:predicted AlkP superfamily pyrophosphatase or phosphodiesterase